MLRSFVLCSLVACGGGGTDDPAPTDTAPPTDTPAQVSTVMAVPCDGTELGHVESTGGFRFSPNNVTISVGQLVDFTNPNEHSVVPGAAPTDSGLKAPKGTKTCLKFTAAGQFNFKCSPHSSMTGTITVN
jgi:plastocyanin